MQESVLGSVPAVFGSRWFLPEPEPALFGSSCPGCGRLDFPPRSLCPACGRPDPERVRLAAEGVIETYTTVHVAPPGFHAPYQVGIVALTDGLRVAAPLRADEAPVDFGQAVRLEAAVIRQDNGMPVLGYRFRTVARSVRAAVAPRPRPAIPPVNWALPGRAWVAGVAMTVFGKQPDRSAEELLLEAALGAVADAGIEASRVQAIFAGTAFGGTAAGQRLLKESPWGGGGRW